jgi:aromatic-L-amino-acid decarboxylase
VLAGRERATGWQSNEAGAGPALVAYTSSQAHSSVEKAARVAGIGSDRLRMIDVDDAYAMRPELLDEAIRNDLAAGLQPCFVNATVGTTSTTAMDPVRAIGEICRRHGVWYHVDAAWAGSAAACPELRHLQDGLELADSYVVNPHKWLLTGLDLSAFYVADREALIRTLSLLPEYLRNLASESGEVIDYRDWHVPLGRRFRALKLWFVIRHYGVTGLRAMIREHVRLGQDLASWVEVHPDFELAAPVPLNLVCFRHTAGDEASQAIMDRVNASGDAYLTHTRLDGRLVLRVNVGQAHTEERHVRALWDLISGEKR